MFRWPAYRIVSCSIRMEELGKQLTVLRPPIREHVGEEASVSAISKVNEYVSAARSKG